MSLLHFIFKPNGFVLDHTNLDIQDDWTKQFQTDKYIALYQWGFLPKNEKASPSALFLHLVHESYIDELTKNSELEIAREQIEISLSNETWQTLETQIPFSLGSEFICFEWIEQLFQKLHAIFRQEIKHFPGSVQFYLAGKNQDLRTPERIFFHLVENKSDDYPFAFLATYATKDKNGVIRHMPLRYALEEYKQDRDTLIKLLSCLNQAAKTCSLLSELIEQGELFHPLKLTSKEAYEILSHIEEIESYGIMCRIPNWWRKKYAHFSLSIKIGDNKPSLLGFDSLLSLQPEFHANGAVFSKEEMEALLMQSEGLAQIKGKWVEVNHKKLKHLLETMEHQDLKDMTMMEALRTTLSDDPDDGVTVSNGAWFQQFLYHLKHPQTQSTSSCPDTVNATLRPYQEVGYNWLCMMHQYGFGACLADDMGLGKTLQVLSFLESLRLHENNAHVLLIVPASLLGNWEKEAARFTPNIPLQILHGKTSSKLTDEFDESIFLTITTYGMAAKLDMLKKPVWDCLILDEAQAIKNPLTKQTKSIKALQARMRIAMSGTPIENDLSNLWSLFDFLNKGLLGSYAEFKAFSKQLIEHPQGYQKLKTMISPFILRRLKTDTSIISDLPEKIEVNDYVSLSKQQVVLYQHYLKDMEMKLEKLEGIERRGLILAALNKLKQICNHPDQYTGEQSYLAKHSGKFHVLKQICETIYEKRERVLVFTQYKEIIPYLSAFLSEIFHQEGFILHGGTPIKQRNEIVARFQQEDYVPYIVLSLKAAGTGLNLTEANHVIHFDRWWNPAVENQATDRAFRIGQHKNVMVHKLICKGTIEEKIDALIASKIELSQQVIGSGKETWITEMDNQQLMDLFRLDMR